MAKLQTKGETSGKVAKTPGTGSAKTPATSSAASPLTDLRSEIDRLFSEFSSRFPALAGGTNLFDWEPWRGAVSIQGLSAPKVDLVETDTAFEVTAELPGLDIKDVNVELRDNVLTLTGEKREEKDQEREKDYHVSERRYGSFRRTFRLPSDVESARAEASFDKGILRVTLPKTPAAQKKTQKIEVKAKQTP